MQDVHPGAQTHEKVDIQVQECSELLGLISLQFKFVVRSDQAPCEIASSDGESVKLLGYKWSTELDVLSPGFAALNLNKKIMGAKKPNKFPVIRRDDVVKLLSSISLTLRMVVSKYSEMFDPVGIWEPINLQLKLHASMLSELEWDHQLKVEDQEPWKQRLVEFVRFGELQAKRCPIPADKTQFLVFT